MRIASLGSGSKGNGTLIEDGQTSVLVDLGFNLKEAARRLGRLGRRPEDVDAILVTHEHGDHINGVAAFARKYGTRVYMTHGTYNPDRQGLLPALHYVNSHRDFRVGTINVTPVAVPHDAREACQYVFSSGGARVGVLTDLGHVTPWVERCYAECDALLLECNHDVQMLMDGPYPWPLKRRVGGDLGHLNNEQALGLLQRVNLSRLSHLVVSHISEQNNTPEAALSALSPALDAWQGEVRVACQDAGFSWIEL